MNKSSATAVSRKAKRRYWITAKCIFSFLPSTTDGLRRFNIHGLIFNGPFRPVTHNLMSQYQGKIPLWISCLGIEHEKLSLLQHEARFPKRPESCRATHFVSRSVLDVFSDAGYAAGGTLCWNPRW